MWSSLLVTAQVKLNGDRQPRRLLAASRLADESVDGPVVGSEHVLNNLFSRFRGHRCTLVEVRDGDKTELRRKRPPSHVTCSDSPAAASSPHASTIDIPEMKNGYTVKWKSHEKQTNYSPATSNCTSSSSSSKSASSSA